MANLFTYRFRLPAAAEGEELFQKYNEAFKKIVFSLAEIRRLFTALEGDVLPQGKLVSGEDSYLEVSCLDPEKAKGLFQSQPEFERLFRLVGDKEIECTPPRLGKLLQMRPAARLSAGPARLGLTR